jgi:NAD(P)H-dependent flavin oxidoreductase YrpB (nitropropane dioxygenase family)
MGVGVSGWRLARAVSLAGQLGVVSGIGLDMVITRRLQLGDPGGDIRRALASFPNQGIAQQILDRYFIAGGAGSEEPFRLSSKPTLHPSERTTNLIVAANFAEIFLAKEGHRGLIGVNYMQKLQMSTPASVYGAMLAGADYVLVGAGIPAEFPSLLDALAAGDAGEVSIGVLGEPAVAHMATVSPETISQGTRTARPKFLAIVASHVLASYLAREERTRPDGFVVEGPTAGGHSAPPRGTLNLDQDGQPVYGPRDLVDVDKMAALGLPYWLAGACASPRLLTEARQAGAVGVQVGSAFALCEESNLTASLKQAVIDGALAGTLQVRADPSASPTGFPFKVADLPGTMADTDVYAMRERLCDAGYLRVPYQKQGGEVGYRCPAEPVDTYLRKGGELADTVGRCCLCNGLLSAIGLGQRSGDGAEEAPIVTIGQDLSFLAQLVGPDRRSYSATDVVAYLLGEVTPPPYAPASTNLPSQVPVRSASHLPR